MLKVKKGDYGIQVNVTHNSQSDVNYSVDGGTETPLTSNNYFIINSEMTSAAGVHIVNFTTTGNDLRVTSLDVYKFQVVE